MFLLSLQRRFETSVSYNVTVASDEEDGRQIVQHDQLEEGIQSKDEVGGASGSGSSKGGASGGGHGHGGEEVRWLICGKQDGNLPIVSLFSLSLTFSLLSPRLPLPFLSLFLPGTLPRPLPPPPSILSSSPLFPPT